MNLNINQKYIIENPGIRCVEWTDAIKMKKKENPQVLLKNTG